ncbi:NERD domain-containing protein [Pseudolabrys sp.]|uniref:nuclease-related domain-containing DEAD/DEAH box helicase n=1 Tax=Pseudolabrys sp. TaxID=1960880 RepID=UPI003D12FC5D
MALFTPPIDPSTMEHGSEADVARAMLKCLSASYIVMHSLPWVNPARDDLDAPAREGEADFLILHRQYGLLILEVKGGEITLKGRLWYRHVKANLKPIKDPVRQARRSLWAFKTRIAHICGKAVADQTVISVAVGFPHCLFKDQPPPDLPRGAIISMDDMADLEPAILRAYRAGGGGQKEMSAADFEAVRRALAPEFRVYEPLRLSVDTNAQMLALLTRQQLQVLRGFDANPRAIIEGVAGSGKTLLAMQRARSFAAKYPTVLLTCFNAELAKWMREELADDLVENGGKITVSNFHRLAAELCKRAGLDFNVSADDPARWWDEIAPDLLAQAALDLYGGEQPYAAIVVDEAQDFSPGWWDALDYLWDNKGPIWAFLDKAQSLRREPMEPPLKDAFQFALDVNCRNTRRIVACANAAANVVSGAFEMAPLGQPPRMIVPSNPAAISGLVQAEVRTLLKDHRLEPRQIAIIGPASKAKGPLGPVSNIDGIPLVEDAVSWREGRGVLCSTARSFKGLEADVVILCDFSGIGHLFTVSDLYVVLTRARSFLIIVAHDRTAKERLESALAAAIAMGADE